MFYLINILVFFWYCKDGKILRGYNQYLENIKVNSYFRVDSKFTITVILRSSVYMTNLRTDITGQGLEPRWPTPTTSTRSREQSGIRILTISASMSETTEL